MKKKPQVIQSGRVRKKLSKKPKKRTKENSAQNVHELIAKRFWNRPFQTKRSLTGVGVVRGDRGGV